MRVRKRIIEKRNGKKRAVNLTIATHENLLNLNVKSCYEKVLRKLFT